MRGDAQKFHDNFLRRDQEALEEFNDGPRGIESALHFTIGRLRDTAAAVLYLLKCEAEREAALDSKEEGEI